MSRLLVTISIACLFHTNASSAEFSGIKIAPYLGYEKAVHLTNGHVNVVLCPRMVPYRDALPRIP